MSTFQYEAINANGTLHKGVIQSDSARTARQLLRAQGLTPVEIREVKNTRFSPTQFSLKKIFTRKKLKDVELALFTRQLATLIQAGLPIADALQAIAEHTEKTQLKTLLHNLHNGIQEGRSLAQTLQQFPAVFPEMYWATVNAGEQSGKLGTILQRLADYTDNQLRLKQQIHQALIYPALMIFVSIGIVSFLLAFVLPKITRVFEQNDQTLPVFTQILMWISGHIYYEGIIIIILVLGLVIGFKILKKSPKGLLKFHRLLGYVPGLNYMSKKINTARYCRTLGMLMGAAVNILPAMRVASALLTNLHMQKTVNQAEIRVKEGVSLVAALKQTHYFSSLTLHLIASGEKSGKLAELLLRAADQEESDFERVVATSLRLFEPFIILVMGFVVLFIVLAILLPIFQLDQVVG